MPGAFLWGWDATNKVWREIVVNADGEVKMVAVIGNLDDIGDVDLTGIADDDIIYWDAAAGEWKPIAHLGVADAHHTKYTNANAKAAAVQSGAIIDGVSKAPTHDAVFDVEAKADKGLVLTITFIIDGGGSVITTGQKGHLEIPFACTINRVTMLADQSGSIIVDIWKRAYADFPPTDAQSITSSAVPTISGAVKSQDSTLTDWTTTITAGDILAFNVDSITDIQRVTISLKVTKT